VQLPTSSLGRDADLEENIPLSRSVGPSTSQPDLHDGGERDGYTPVSANGGSRGKKGKGKAVTFEDEREVQGEPIFDVGASDDEDDEHHKAR